LSKPPPGQDSNVPQQKHDADHDENQWSRE